MERCLRIWKSGEATHVVVSNRAWDLPEVDDRITGRNFDS